MAIGVTAAFALEFWKVYTAKLLPAPIEYFYCLWMVMGEWVGTTIGVYSPVFFYCFLVCVFSGGAFILITLVEWTVLAFGSGSEREG